MFFFLADSSFLACDCGSYLCCAGLWLAQMTVWKSWLTHTLWGGQWTFIHGSLVLSSPERQRKTSFTMSLQLIWSLICVYVSLKHKHNLSSSIFMFFCFAFPFQERKTEQIQSDGMKGSERIWWRRGELYSGKQCSSLLANALSSHTHSTDFEQ